MIYILNGPPGCGKDTLADMLYENADIELKDSFKSALIDEVSSHYDIPSRDIRERNNNRELKEIPWVDGLSVRQMLINVSENIIKPLYGKNYFGTLKGWEWKLISHYSTVVSDGGFKEEINAVGNIVGHENVVVIRLYREGFNFDNDSRDYIRLGDVKCPVCDLQLYDDNIEAAYEGLKNIINMFK